VLAQPVAEVDIVDDIEAVLMTPSSNTPFMTVMPRSRQMNRRRISSATSPWALAISLS
jgi:GTPase